MGPSEVGPGRRADGADRRVAAGGDSHRPWPPPPTHEPWLQTALFMSERLTSALLLCCFQDQERKIQSLEVRIHRPLIFCVTQRDTLKWCLARNANVMISTKWFKEAAQYSITHVFIWQNAFVQSDVQVKQSRTRVVKQSRTKADRIQWNRIWGKPVDTQ